MPNLELISNYADSNRSMVPSVDFQLASIYLTKGDCIDLLGFSFEDVTFLNQVISDTWARDIKRIYHKSGVTRIKLWGYPLSGDVCESKSSKNARRMICVVLAALEDRNWIFQTSFSNGVAASSLTSTDALIFKKQAASEPHQWFAIQQVKDEWFCIINAPPEVISIISDEVKSVLFDQEFTQGHDASIIICKLRWDKILPLYTSQSARQMQVETLLVEIIDANSYGANRCINMGTSKCCRDTWFCRTAYNVKGDLLNDRNLTNLNRRPRPSS